MEKNDELKNYESVEVAPFIRTTREELISDNDFVDQKYHKYVPILAERLNKIHGMNHDEAFWKKCLALDLIRYITLFYDIFKLCEQNFLDGKFDCHILSESSYFTPKKFNEQRDFFQCTAYGQEQIFSIYIKLFYPGKFQSIDDQFSWPILRKKKSENKFVHYLKRLAAITPEKILNKISNALYKFRQPRMVITGSYFSAAHLNDIISKSKGLIRTVPIKSDFTFSEVLQKDKRKEVSQTDDTFDRFDKFFFTSIKFCLPKIIIEDFNQAFSYYSGSFKQFTKLKYVVNESWIGNNHAAIAIAVMQSKGVEHIYNEHNFLSHQFLANNHKYIFPLVDEFVSLGWYKENMPKLIKGASLFEWVEEQQYTKEHNILFVSGQPAVKPPEISASYGDFGAFNAKSHLEFNYNFFAELKENTLRTVVYRGYPLDSLMVYYLNPHMFVYDQEYVLRKYMTEFKLIDNVSRSAKVLMQKSRLIIVDYLSTSYIESMQANIPTIFFWNKEIYPLMAEYSGFYESLISVGICQTNSSSAAMFIENIKSDPEKWWRQTSVQEAKNKFLINNFGKINILKQHLLKKVNTV